MQCSHCWDQVLSENYDDLLWPSYPFYWLVDLFNWMTQIGYVHFQFFTRRSQIIKTKMLSIIINRIKNKQTIRCRHKMRQVNFANMSQNLIDRKSRNKMPTNLLFKMWYLQCMWTYKPRGYTGKDRYIPANRRNTGSSMELNNCPSGASRFL